MIRVQESADDTRYDIYFKANKYWRSYDKFVDKIGGLIHFQRGSDNLEDAIKMCDELNNTYIQRRTSKGERTNGNFVVLDGFTHSIEYESER